VADSAAARTTTAAILMLDIDMTNTPVAARQHTLLLTAATAAI
jgi:hypothetical protein